MSEKQNIVELIAKQLQGAATPEEMKELQLWLKSDAACQQEYDEMALIWQKSAPLLAEPRFHPEAAWLKLDEKIERLNPRPKEHFDTIISFLFSTTKRAAVVIVALTIMALGGYWFFKQSQWKTVTASNKNETVTLPDQSVVLVRKGSSIKYLKTFDKKERRVQLTGEAFFKVQHNERQPFLVTTANTEVKVLGTTFLVNSAEAVDEVVVVTGKVNVTDTKETNNQVLLTKGQRAVLQHNRFQQENVSDSNFLAWETGELNFHNATLQKALQDISHYYGKSVELAPALAATAGGMQINVTFNNQPIEQVLDEIKLITGLLLKKEKDKIIFYRN